MAGVETNVFPIVNIAELSTGYKLYQIKGIQRDQAEYYQNLGYIKRTLSYRLRKPVTTIERDRCPYLVVCEDGDDPPSPFPLVRTAVAFERIPGIRKLDYTVRSPDNDEICLRFLQFMVQEPLFSNQELWQPGAGRPFFEKTSTDLTDELARHTGFSVRVMVTPEGGLGLCIDVTHKTVSKSALPTHLSRDAMPEWAGRYCVYHWGHQWYEIQVLGLSDFGAMEHLVPRDGKWVPLLECIVQESAKPIPPELAQVEHDASVVLYKNNRGEDRAAPSPLCYPVQRTDDEETGERHSGTILPPHQRRWMIRNFVGRYLSPLKFGVFAFKWLESPYL